MTANKDYEYEIAISFLAKDEPLASQIRDALLPLNVFVYSKRQEAVAGSEGVASFREIFRNSSRIALVLFRSGWGETPWTRVEETAIRDYCLAEGWDRLFFVRLDHEGETPKWVPESYIYMDLTTFGIPDLVGAIKFKLMKLGVQLPSISPADRAHKISLDENFRNETQNILSSNPQVFYDACAELFTECENAIESIRKSTEWKISSGSERDTFIASEASSSLTVTVQEMYANTATRAYLLLQTFKGKVLTPIERRTHYMFERPSELHNKKILLERTPKSGWCWKHNEKIYTPIAAAEFIVDELISAREHVKRYGHTTY